MATREQVLIGFQLVNKINIGNDMLAHTAEHFCKRCPHTAEPLVFAPKAQPGEISQARPATVDDIKSLAEDSCKIVDVEIDTRLKNFLLRWQDNTDIVNGLAHFSTPRGAVDRDRDEILTHTPNIRTVNALIQDEAGLRANGNLLSLYKEQVEMWVDAEQHWIQTPHFRVTEQQDLLNAAAFELRGLSSYTGEEKYKTVEECKVIALARREAASRLWGFCPDTPETRGFLAVWQYFESNIEDAKTANDLTALGEYIDTHVPQLPFVRRWWAF